MDKKNLIGKIAVQVGPNNSLSIGNLYVVRPYVYEELDIENGIDRPVVDLLNIEENLIETAYLSQFNHNGNDWRYRVLSETEINNLKLYLKGEYK
jgi:hypothetical protein